MAKTNGHAHNSRRVDYRGSLWLNRSYNFVDKNPRIDAMRTAIADARPSLLRKHSDLAALAGCSTSTITNMLDGKTMNPLSRTLDKIAHAIGKEWSLTDGKSVNFEKELPIAIEQRKQHYAMLRSAQERKEKREAKKRAERRAAAKAS